MNYQSNEPYNSLPLLLPEEKFWKTFAVFEQLNLANKALAELKGRISAIPNPRIFIHTLSLQEAKESSAIENVVTTNDKLFKAFTSDRYADPNTKEVLRYGKVLTSAFAELKAHNTFSIPFIENIYSNITDEIDGIRDIKNLDTLANLPMQMGAFPVAPYPGSGGVLDVGLKCGTKDIVGDVFLNECKYHRRLK